MKVHDKFLAIKNQAPSVLLIWKTRTLNLIEKGINEFKKHFREPPEGLATFELNQEALAAVNTLDRKLI